MTAALRRVFVVAVFAAAAFAAAAPPAQAATCTADLGGACGGYMYSGIPMSTDAYRTYILTGAVGVQPGTTETINVTDPGNWNAVANVVPYGNRSVQTFPDVQQLANTWNGSGWGGTGAYSNTPLSALSSLKINYSESMSQRDADTIAEFAPDIWTENYPSDVMFWVDTQGRCDPGAYGGTILGTATFGGQTWTVNRYGGVGAEIIFVLDSDPAVPNSCAQQTSGTIDIKAGFDWLTGHGYMPSAVFTQLDTGWEITSADNTTFTMNSYSITATVGGGSVQQAPAVTTGTAAGVSRRAATLTGAVNPEGQATSYRFEYGTTTAYGASVPVPDGDAGSGTSGVPVSAALTGLTAGTVYHYRLIAANGAGTATGADQMFTTKRHGRPGHAAGPA